MKNNRQLYQFLPTVKKSATLTLYSFKIFNYHISTPFTTCSTSETWMMSLDFPWGSFIVAQKFNLTTYWQPEFLQWNASPCEN